MFSMTATRSKTGALPTWCAQLLCPAQARKEGEEDVVGKLEKVLSVAMEEKQKTLRPEIQLLNRLLGAKTGAERTAVRHTHSCIICSVDVLSLPKT